MTWAFQVMGVKKTKREKKVKAFEGMVMRMKRKEGNFE